MSLQAEPAPELQRVLTERIDRIRDRMAAAALRAGRAPESVRLVAVSKTATEAQAVAAVLAGAAHLGENRVQSARPRIEALRAAGLSPVLHMIGHLQRNKVGAVLEHFDRIDSVDSLRLARRIEHLAAAQGRTVPVLLQVNVSADPAKHGFAPETIADAAGEIAEMPHLRIEGLMTILLHTTDESRLRKDFGRMRALRDRLRSQLPALPWSVLSMGMTEDFEIAIEEASTEVRVGRAIFSDPSPRPNPSATTEDA